VASALAKERKLNRQSARSGGGNKRRKLIPEEDEFLLEAYHLEDVVGGIHLRTVRRMRIRLHYLISMQKKTG
jgi:hypothetical protein